MNCKSVAIITLSLFLARPAIAGEISGVVLGSNGDPVEHVAVILCDQETGIPVNRETFRPFTEGNIDLKGLAFAATDAEGTFHFEGVAEGTYRLLAQAWPETPEVEELLDINGKEIVLYGVLDEVLVPSDGANGIKIRPLGDCVVTLDEDFPNSDGYLLISTVPMSADPILGYVGWKGPFLQNMIGANRMPYGVTRISGLPERKFYLSVFAVDNNGGFGAGTVEARSGEEVRAEFIPIVCGWSNGRHTPPPELEKTFDEVKPLMNPGQWMPFDRLNRMLAEEGIVVERTAEYRNRMNPYYEQIDVVVTLPSGREVRFADVLASINYVHMERMIEDRKNQGTD